MPVLKRCKQQCSTIFNRLIAEVAMNMPEIRYSSVREMETSMSEKRNLRFRTLETA